MGGDRSSLAAEVEEGAEEGEERWQRLLEEEEWEEWEGGRGGRAARRRWGGHLGWELEREREVWRVLEGVWEREGEG